LWEAGVKDQESGIRVREKPRPLVAVIAGSGDRKDDRNAEDAERRGEFRNYRTAFPLRLVDFTELAVDTR